MTLPQKVTRLVETFDRNIESYRQGRYNETQVRREFIDPFFKELGWDMDNTQGYAEAYKDVIHEDAIRVGNGTRAPDYCFRIGGTRKFFLEAKKPSVNIKDDPSPAYQLRRYAWSAKLPLSILTDFEEFAVYDCRVRPNKTDKPAKARILYFTYDEYAERWDEIASRFSRDAVLKGSFDKYAQSERRKRGTAEVDAAFLAEIETWRDQFARNIALRNPDLTNRELNFAVQRTIDRIIFLRICEDRGIEPYKQLEALTNGIDVYPRLVALFRRADDRYNSGLFHFMREKDRTEGPDELTPELVIDDKPLKEILRSLYYPDSPYEFSVLPAEILGHVYEQFLGKVITLTAGHRARVEDKPEVKKAGGVYYTPSYIVDYIVEHTVGKLLEGASVKFFKTKPPRLDRPLHILDPACGSGSFLLGAYQMLLDWYRDYYEKNDPKQWAASKHPPIYQAGTQGWKLTTAERKRILLDHIYGVDIDTQAVEVTKLSLLLRVLEGEKNLVLFHNERALPDLASNIKCGNSLIGPDFYEGKQFTLFDDDERLRINAFDWYAEFPHVFQDRGFDAVIGNPPYIRMETFKELKNYLQSHYRVHDERSDLYAYFIEREQELLRDAGMFGMIVSNKFLRANYGRNVRQFLSDAVTVHHIVDLAGLPVFPGATVRTIVLITSKDRRDVHAVYSPPPDRETFWALGTSTSLGSAADSLAYKLPQAVFSGVEWNLAEPRNTALIDRLRSLGHSLVDVVGGRICRGVVSGLTAAFVISSETRDSILRVNPEAQEIIHPFLQGRNIRRYRLEPGDEHLIYAYHGIDMKPYPAIVDHLRPFRKRLESRATTQAWYELQQPQLAYKELLEGRKIVFPDIATECRFTLDCGAHFGANTVYFLPTDDLYLLGLLNSRIALFFFAQTCAALEGPGQAYLRFFGQYLQGFPVRRLDTATQSHHNRIAETVEGMLQLHATLASAKTPDEKNVLQRQIDGMDQQIDQLVYELYGLTDDEIKIVEEATR